MESTTTDVVANTSTTTDEVKVSITTDVNLDVELLLPIPLHQLLKHLTLLLRQLETKLGKESFCRDIPLIKPPLELTD